MAFCRDVLCGTCATHPRKALSWSWFISIILVVIALICAIAVAAKSNTSSSRDSPALGFASLWTMLVLIGLSVGGSMVMRKYRTPLGVGFFLGAVIITSQQMLILCAVFLGRAHEAAGLSETSADRAFAVFCLFLCAVYAVFATLLAVFREELIQVDATKYNTEDVNAPTTVDAAAAGV